MNKIKRWTTTLVGNFDTVMKQVENHEAIIASSIKESQATAAKAKARYKRIIADGSAMTNRLKELKKSESQWADRAIRTHKTNKEKALECIRRRNQAQTMANQLETQIQEHKNTEKKLAADIHLIEQRIIDLKIKKNHFSTREYRNQAMKASDINGVINSDEIEDIFERWEVKLSDAEFDDTHHTDALEHEFSETEDLTDIESDLEDLINAEKNA